MKATRIMRDSLLPLIAADEGQISVGPRRLTIRQLQAILDYQGYYSAVRCRYYPIVQYPSGTEGGGAFMGWRSEPRTSPAPDPPSTFVSYDHPTNQSDVRCRLTMECRS